MKNTAGEINPWDIFIRTAKSPLFLLLRREAQLRRCTCRAHCQPHRTKSDCWKCTHTPNEQILTNTQAHMQSHSREQTQGMKKKETELEKKTNNRPGYMHTDGQTNICSLSFSNTKKKKSTNTYTVCVTAKASLSPVSFESASKPDKFNRCKNKGADGGDSAPAPPASPLSTPSRLPPIPPVLFPWLAGWLAAYSENIEWKAFSTQPVSQSVSHLGKGDLDGESSLASGFDPRVLWQSLRLRNLESLFHRPVSPSTRAFMASPLPLGSIYLISNIFCVHIYMCVCRRGYILGFILGGREKKKKKAIFLWIQFPRCLCNFIRYRLVMKGTAQCVICLWAYLRQYPRRIILYILCLRVLVHMYQVGFTWAGSTSLSITMDVQW